MLRCRSNLIVGLVVVASLIGCRSMPKTSPVASNKNPFPNASPPSVALASFVDDSAGRSDPESCAGEADQEVSFSDLVIQEGPAVDPAIVDAIEIASNMSIDRTTMDLATLEAIAQTQHPRCVRPKQRSVTLRAWHARPVYPTTRRCLISPMRSVTIKHPACTLSKFHNSLSPPINLVSRSRSNPNWSSSEWPNTN